MGLFSKKTKSQPKMKTLKMEIEGERASSKSPKKKSDKGAKKPMDFSAWVDHYVQMSNGNPV